jgi:type IV secretion system pilin
VEAVLGMFKLAAGCGATGTFPPSLYQTGPGLSCVNGQIQLTDLSGVLVLIGNVVRIVIAVSGALALITILAASIFYVTSAGSPERIKRAREIIQYTATGLVLITLAYAIITFIANGF